MKCALLIAPTILMFVEGAASQDARQYRIGILAPGPADPFRKWALPELERSGFVESRNLVVEDRVGTMEQMPALAQALAASKPDLVVAIGSSAQVMAKQATDTIPILAYGDNPVDRGLASSLAKPGGNVTGIAILAQALDGKRLHLLAEAVPTARRIAALMLAGNPSAPASEAEMRKVANQAGLELLTIQAAGPQDYKRAIDAARATGARALLVTANPIFFRDAAQISNLAEDAGLPTACEWREMAVQGCLIGYGASRADLYTRLGGLAVRILKGQAPAEIPIEEPTRLELVLNLRTARALGLELPTAVLVRADEVIE